MANVCIALRCNRLGRKFADFQNAILDSEWLLQPSSRFPAARQIQWPRIGIVEKTAHGQEGLSGGACRGKAAIWRQTIM